MLKNITFSADENLIRMARRQAALEDTTLNQLFREWLERYVVQEESDRQATVQRYYELMQQLGPRFAGKFTREELNERR